MFLPSENHEHLMVTTHTSIAHWRITLSAASLFANQLTTALIGALTSTIFTCSLYYVYSIQYYYLNITLFIYLQDLSIDSWIQPLIWLGGPICGLCQPFFGHLTDHLHSQIFNRKFFITLSSVVQLFVFVVFGFLYRQCLYPFLLFDFF